MSVKVKAYLLGKYEQVKEIRRFVVDQDMFCSFESLSRKTAAVFSNLKSSSFSLFYKDEDGDLVVFSSDDELMMGKDDMTDSTFRLFIKEKKEQRRDFALHALLPSIFGHAPPHAPPPTSSYTPTIAPPHAPPHTSPYAPAIAPSHAPFLASLYGSSHAPPQSQPHAPPQIQPHTPPQSQPQAPLDVPSNNSTDAASPVVHIGFTCDGCRGDIIGERYKCSDCPDFDLCSTCKDEGKHSHHVLLPISKPLHEF